MEDTEVQGCKLQGTENLTIVQLQMRHGNGIKSMGLQLLCAYHTMVSVPGLYPAVILGISRLDS